MVNSLDMMEKFNKSLSDIENINNNLDDITNKINTKIKIINTHNFFLNQLMENLRLENGSFKNNRLIFKHKSSNIVGGNFSSYGQVVHSAFAKLPNSLFNFVTETGPIYKDNGIVEFYNKGDEENKDYKYEYSNILKHESDKTKKDVFKVYEQDRITMAIQLNIGSLSNSTLTNMIEICPYIPGSFSIEAIRIFTIDQYYSNNMLLPEKTINKVYSKVGATRIQLDKKYNIYRIEFDIRLEFEMNGYPFGLRHIYFYNADMNTENDYIVAEVNQDDYIAYVGQDISLITTSGNINTTADNYGVEYYMFFDNDTLQTPLSNPIARNIKKFYAKIPLKEPLIGIEFKDIQLR